MKPRHGVLSALLPTREMDLDTWVGMINAQVDDMIKPYLDRFTLQTLGSLNISGPGNEAGRGHHRMVEDAPRFLTDGFSVDTQGIFCFVPKHDPVVGQEQAIGLTRGGLWVIVTIALEDQGTRPLCTGFRIDGQGKLKDTYEDRTYWKATEVTVALSNPAEICRLLNPEPATGGKELYAIFVSVIYGWHRQTTEAYNQTLALVQQIEFAQEVLGIVTEKR